MTHHPAASIVSRVLYPGTVVSTTSRSTAPPPGGLYLGRGNTGPVLAGPEEHVLVLGPPRSGKTTRLLIPSVLRHRGPAVITSTKPDVLRTTIASRSRLGRCWYWDPSGTTITPDDAETLRWSPVTDCETWDESVARAHALATAARPDHHGSEAHWIERAEALLAPLLHAAAITGADLAAVLAWLHRRELTPAISLLQSAEAARPADILDGLAHTDPRELSGIFSTAESVLGAYRSDAALRTARHPNFDPSAFAASNDSLYIVASATSQAQSASLIVALLDQIRAATYRWHPRRPMLFALDEVANIAPLADLPATLADGGSQGLLVLACLQDLSQARARWGRAADGFLTLFTNKILLPGVADVETLKAVSTLAGHIDIPLRSVTTGGSRWSRSTTVTTRRQPRLPEDQVASLADGTALLISPRRIQKVRL